MNGVPIVEVVAKFFSSWSRLTVGYPLGGRVRARGAVF